VLNFVFAHQAKRNMNLFYRSFGQGPHLLILHGLFGLSDNWVSLGHRYAESFTVWIPDLRNHGQSPHHPEMGYLTMVNDIFDFFELHQIEKSAIIGHSMGGKVAMLFATQHPEMISKLVIADIGPGPTPTPNLQKTIIETMSSIDLSTMKNRRQVIKQLQDTFTQRGLIDLILKNIGRNSEGIYYWKPNLEAFYQNLDALAANIKFSDYYPNPTLLLKGEFSNYITEKDLNILYEHFPLMKEAIIHNAGHWLHDDNPQEFFEVTWKFLDS